ncbi:Pkinase-domain-containing protein [Yamadazyma tenuis ATCC 10573]|uniref:mitogen-activated protein kinase kinase kinase n=1 Tax=Candida tenuis (strain ATCC 10573 / BCRC 21748 / CBS 615 / JCM 9827 / NBRC 10315 / NRRL Y-1498 / VKM Y-70) TaxID=590646 RepID=G3B1K7_CANTC|nr:Pkinase-domain-containing protein [Yamadazyma tenuis ATCC 10573]EGV64468.1 Pkinase-domain-containing protein [Yamadazyma tenuis ATCC 10573]
MSALSKNLDSESPTTSQAVETPNIDLKELKQWLTKSNCQNYYTKFVEQGVTYELVPELDTNALKELGVTKVGDRLKLEIAVSNLKAEKLKKLISIDELYNSLNLYTLASPTYRPKNKNSNKNITFILADGSLKKVNVTGCFNAQSIKRKVLRKLGIKSQENKYDTYIQNSNSIDAVSLLYDVELVTICYSPERLEKHRVMLCEKGQYPTSTQVEVSAKIMAKYERFNKAKSINTQQEPAINQPPTLRQVFGQRPPSELISSNLAEYFPEAHHKELEQSIRNSVRYSVRFSRRLPYNGLGLGSNLSVNSRRTIGEMMVNHVNSIEEVVNPGDNYSIFSKPSINSDKSNLSGSQSPYGGDSKYHTTASSNKARLSIAANFVDQSNDNNRYSRIELLNVDSDDEDYDDYFDDEPSPFLEEDGPKNWLKGARIGSGSFGTVYLGMSPFTGELMAVKQVSLNNSQPESQNLMVEALQHEMLLLKNLNHKNIVRYLGSSISEEHLNIFLEYVPGGSVQSMLMSYGPFEEPLIRNFIRQVLIGLTYLHGEDIIHRDIKGANILIDIKGTVKISDFGISKKITNKSDDSNEPDKKTSRRASLQGSVYWMAPEVVKQTAYTKKADIWSVGCLIVEMFTGKHPFPNFTQMQAIFKIGTHVSPVIPEWCTPEAKEFLTKTFELEYENRPDAIDLLSKSFLNPLIISKQ